MWGIDQNIYLWLLLDDAFPNLVIEKAVLKLNNGLANLLNENFALKVVSDIGYEDLGWVFECSIELLALVLVGCYNHNVGSLIDVPKCERLSYRHLSAYYNNSFAAEIRSQSQI